MIDLANQRADLMAQVAEFKKDCMELWFVPELAASYSNRNFFSYSIIEDNQVFFMIEQARQLWSFWNKAEAQAVPETHLLIPKDKVRDLVAELESAFESNVHMTIGDLLPLQQDLKVILETSESGAAQ
ncbi:hypothetical protein [Acinetobacter pittii]|uniref:hypothetical protein n=1 Tax=Acinetobacter pittii TaxID=48296 RepID=UPI0021CF6272|nr:hypothetical protein [Acinetobacter pittii]